MAAIRAGIRKRNHFIGRNRPVFFNPGLHVHTHRVSGTSSNKFFFTGIFKSNRAAGGDGQMSRNIFDQYFLFAAKSTTDARFDDPNSFDGQPKNGRNNPPDVERYLGAGAYYQAV